MLDEYADQVDMKLVVRADIIGRAYASTKKALPMMRKDWAELMPEYLGEEWPPRGTLAALILRSFGIQVKWKYIVGPSLNT